MSPKRKTIFVIFASPQQLGRPGIRYIAKDGSKTELRSRAEFAKQKNVKLTAFTYIGQDDFTDFEIQHDS